MLLEERLTAAVQNLEDFKPELEDWIDFHLVATAGGNHRIEVLRGTVELAEKLKRHRISWEHLIKEVHTLTPRKEAGSQVAKLDHAD